VKRFLLLAFIGCSSSSSSDASQTLGDLQYAPPPSSWSHRDTKEISRLVSRWTPEENVNKESISIIRTTALPNVKGAAPAQLEAMLMEAQRSLPAPSLLRPTMGKTKQGLQEIEVVADFVPSGLKDSYHRVHAMIVDGDVLIHVLYTARTPDPSLAMFHQVVDTIRHGKAAS
jgi:hypothetical protein